MHRRFHKQRRRARRRRRVALRRGQRPRGQRPQGLHLPQHRLRHILQRRISAAGEHGHNARKHQCLPRRRRVDQEHLQRRAAAKRQVGRADDGRLQEAAHAAGSHAQAAVVRLPELLRRRLPAVRALLPRRQHGEAPEDVRVREPVNASKLPKRRLARPRHHERRGRPDLRRSFEVADNGQLPADDHEPLGRWQASRRLRARRHPKRRRANRDRGGQRGGAGASFAKPGAIASRPHRGALARAGRCRRRGAGAPALRQPSCRAAWHDPQRMAAQPFVAH